MTETEEMYVLTAKKRNKKGNKHFALPKRVMGCDGNPGGLKGGCIHTTCVSIYILFYFERSTVHVDLGMI